MNSGRSTINNHPSTRRSRMHRRVQTQNRRPHFDFMRTLSVRLHMLEICISSRSIDPKILPPTTVAPACPEPPPETLHRARLLRRHKPTWGGKVDIHLLILNLLQLCHVDYSAHIIRRYREFEKTLALKCRKGVTFEDNILDAARDRTANVFSKSCARMIGYSSISYPQKQKPHEEDEQSDFMPFLHFPLQSTAQSKRLIKDSLSPLVDWNLELLWSLKLGTWSLRGRRT
jgi:hypothetical protein